MALFICITRRRRNGQNHGNRSISGASAFTGAEGKAASAELLNMPLSASLNSPASFGNSLNQRPNTYYSEANSFSTAGAAGVGAGFDAAHQLYANAAPRTNTMSSFSGYSQPPVSQYGPDHSNTSYNPWDPPAMAGEAAAGAYAGANSVGGKRDSNYRLAAAPESVPPVRANPYLAPGQIMLSYSGSAAPSQTVSINYNSHFCGVLLRISYYQAGSSSSRSDVYTTKPTYVSEEKRRLALTSRSEEEPEEAPPIYST